MSENITFFPFFKKNTIILFASEEWWWWNAWWGPIRKERPRRAAF